jgi:hypothetical protein
MAKPMAIATMFALPFNRHREFATVWTNVAARCAAGVSHGADAIKFVATGGVLSDIKAGLDQQFTDDEIRSIIETPIAWAGTSLLMRTVRPASMPHSKRGSTRSSTEASSTLARSSCSSPKALSMCLRSLPASRSWRWHRATAC